MPFARLVVRPLFLVTGAWMISQFRGVALAMRLPQGTSLALADRVVFVIEGLVALAVGQPATSRDRGRGLGTATADHPAARRLDPDDEVPGVSLQ